MIHSRLMILEVVQNDVFCWSSSILFKRVSYDCPRRTSENDDSVATKAV